MQCEGIPSFCVPLIAIHVQLEQLNERIVCSVNAGGIGLEVIVPVHPDIVRQIIGRAFVLPVPGVDKSGVVRNVCVKGSTRLDSGVGRPGASVELRVLRGKVRPEDTVGDSAKLVPGGWSAMPCRVSTDDVVGDNGAAKTERPGVVGVVSGDDAVADSTTAAVRRAAGLYRVSCDGVVADDAVAEVQSSAPCPAEIC